MSEGTAREIIERAAKQACESGELTSGRGIYWLIAKYVDAALTEAGALAPAGLTADQVEALAFAVQRAAYYTNRSAHPPEDHSQIAVCRRAVATLRALVAPAADAATGEPS